MIDNDVDTPGRYTRRSVYDDEPESADREISLGTPTILAIFFVLAVVCAAFFGFGYSIGRKSIPPSPLVTDAVPVPSTLAAKPTAGVAATPVAASVVKPLEDSSATSAPEAPTEKSAASPADATIVGDKPEHPAPVPAVPHAAAPAPLPVTATPQPAGTFMVQVAAVSSQDVANILLSSLQKKGYNVALHHEPQDKLLHVQIGPFADKKQAEAMRQRVIADGFNAIVK